MPLTLGEPAPNFALPNQHGQVVSLGDLRGQWAVLYFYPKDDTPGCTVEACEFSGALEQFAGLDCRVLGVSADNAASHQAFIDKFKLRIDLLSDETTQMLQAYGVWVRRERDGKSFMGIARQTVLIDPQGNVAHLWLQVTPAGHAQQVRETLAAVRGRG